MTSIGCPVPWRQCAKLLDPGSVEFTIDVEKQVGEALAKKLTESALQVARQPFELQMHGVSMNFEGRVEKVDFVSDGFSGREARVTVKILEMDGVTKCRERQPGRISLGQTKK